MSIRGLQRWIGAREAGAHGVVFFGAAMFAVTLALVLLFLGVANPSGAAVNQQAMRIARAAAGGFSDEALQSATREMDPAMLALAQRYDVRFVRPDAGALTLSAETAPFAKPAGAVAPEQAVAFNAALPFSLEPNPAARPFSLKKAAELDRQRALECMTQAIYYEAAFEPEEGLEAVAQVVINRVRHPAFPKTVCGVVFQGSDRITGCQFSFTCDGALAKAPAAWAWERARRVAQAALNGRVMAAVGGATHYHTDYVAPYWAPRLYKVKQVGAHIFYRWPGGWGLPAAFNGRYAGIERPGIDVGGDPNKMDLDSLKLAGLEGAADAAHGAPLLVASLTAAAPAPVEKTPTMVPDHLPVAEAVEEPPAPVVIVKVPPKRPSAPPRLAMPD